MNIMLKNIYRVVSSFLGIEIHRVKKTDKLKSTEFKRLKKIPNGKVFTTSLLGKPFTANHRGSFMFLYREIFEQGVYEFKSPIKDPYILDCGVNVGVSVIYFKKLYPEAEIIGFEPDEELFEIANKNVKEFNLFNVQVLKKGVWKEDGEITFFSEGNDAGRIAKSDDLANLKKIETVRLSSFLTKPVDFLKIDIEGAESAVLQECADKLHLVNQMFIEYHSFINEKQELATILQILDKSGFRYVISCPKVLNPNPFTKHTDYLGIDFLLNIFAFRSGDR